MIKRERNQSYLVRRTVRFTLLKYTTTVYSLVVNSSNRYVSSSPFIKSVLILIINFLAQYKSLRIMRQQTRCIRSQHRSHNFAVLLIIRIT